MNETGRNPGAMPGRKHPARAGGFNDEESFGQGEELAACVAVRGRPFPLLLAREANGEKRDIAFVEAFELGACPQRLALFR